MNLLYIKANPKKIETSSSLKLGEEFLEQIKKKDSNIDIKTIDLYAENIQDIDYDVMEATFKLMQNQELSKIQDEKLAIQKQILDDFLKADMVVIAAPMWELLYPSKLKVFIDIITKVNVTFKYTDQGIPQGLLDSQKKIIFIQASGGNYLDSIDSNFKDIPSLKEAQNFANLHLRASMKFIGLEDYKHIYAPYQSVPNLKEEFYQKALSELTEYINNL